MKSIPLHTPFDFMQAQPTIQSHKTTPREAIEVTPEFEISNAFLKDAQVPGISNCSRVALAYEALRMSIQFAQIPAYTTSEEYELLYNALIAVTKLLLAPADTTA